MKTINQKMWVIVALLIMATSVNLDAQSKKTDTITIKASVVCKQCKDRIENGLAFEKGVKDVVVDLETKTVTIRYNTKSTTPDDLRRKISKLGYDADNIPCDKVAYEKLPPCCKKDAPKH